MNPRELFEHIARVTSQMIAYSDMYKSRLDEDFITTINLLTISVGSNRTLAWEDTRVDEHRKGCDFELWIGHPTGGWYRYAIQAKRVNAKGKYAKLGHTVGGRLQLDLLEEYARVNKATAAYCFYNLVLRPFPWHCDLPVESKQLGVSIAPTSVVRAALSKRAGRSFQWIHQQPETRTWRCLINCPCANSNIHPASWILQPSHYYAELPTGLARLFYSDDPTAVTALEGLRPKWLVFVDDQGLVQPIR